jgi:hypothetical protein
MKLTHVMIAMLLLVGSVGCGKTVSELRANGDAIAENSGTLLKKVFGAGVAVYDIVKNVVEDMKDNAVTVKEAVVGTEAIPAK